MGDSRMEAKLKEYRALRRRKEFLDTTKEQLLNFKVINLLVNMFTDMEKTNEEKALLENEEQQPEKSRPTILIQPEDPHDIDAEIDDPGSWELKPKDSWPYLILKWFIYLIIWFSFYLYFIYIQFGAVYFGISVLVGIYYNTRTRPKRKGELSAYSVFNENCASIGGTVKAEQLEREMMLGSTGVGFF